MQAAGRFLAALIPVYAINFAIEALIRKSLEEAGVSRIEIQRTANKVTVNIHSAKPGIIIAMANAK